MSILQCECVKNLGSDVHVNKAGNTLSVSSSFNVAFWSNCTTQSVFSSFSLCVMFMRADGTKAIFVLVVSNSLS